MSTHNQAARGIAAVRSGFFEVTSRRQIEPQQTIAAERHQSTKGVLTNRFTP